MRPFPKTPFKLTDAEVEGKFDIIINVNTKKGKNKFEKIIKDLIDDDCWGLSIDNQVIFNSYHSYKTKNWNDIITDNIKRDSFYKNLNYFLDFIYTGDDMNGTTLDIYMALNPTRKLHYTYKDQSWNLKYYSEDNTI